jgi:hypothetical protein
MRVQPGQWFRRAVLAHRGRAFLVMVAAFLAFGAGKVNLIMLLAANLRLIAAHGWIALGDGALRQLLELLLTALASLAAYVVFKACEYRLVRDVADGRNQDPASRRD